MGALVVFAEHRYFGISFPFDRSVALTKGYNQYLTVENTMMDYVELIKFIKEDYNCEDRAVIAFGGSYGGMLAAWLRMKYPATFQGALAASAPILYFKNAPSTREDAFSEVATKDFADVYPVHQNCSKGIKEGFETLVSLKDNKTAGLGYAEISSMYKTCSMVNSSQDIMDLYAHIQNAFLYMAMTDYPYESAFLQPMPASPVNVSCESYENITVSDGKTPSMSRQIQYI